MNISKRLYLSFTAVIVISVIIGIMGIVGMQSLYQAGLTMYDEQVVGLEKLGEAVKHFTLTGMDINYVAIKSLYDDQKGALDARSAFEANAEAFAQMLRESVTLDELNVLYQPIADRFNQDYLPNSRRIMELSISDIPDHIRKLEINVLLAANIEITEHLSAALDNMMTAHSSLGKFLSQNNNRLKNILIGLQFIFLAAAIIISVILSHRITRSIVGVVENIHEEAQKVHNGAQQISGSSTELSDVAAQQHNAVENLISNMSVINDQTEKNTANAKLANDLSKKSKEHALKGNESMEDMIKSIDGIKVSSDNIANIIKVIENIASQTNILALNASVESVRAGEAGRSFSIVAEEVRNLATKSHDAAQQTADLIKESIMRVDEGTRMARSTVDAFDTIVSDITEMSEFISEIDNSSMTQASLIFAVNSSIEEISKSVDVNKSASQEAAGAAQEMLAQADALNNTIAVLDASPA